MNFYYKKYEDLVYFRQHVQPISRWNKLSKEIQAYNLPPLYAEYHHIKPKSLYPELAKDPNNIVCFTAYEHIMAHKYLMLWYKEEYGQFSIQCIAMTRAYLKTIHKNTGRTLSYLSEEEAAIAKIYAVQMRSFAMKQRWKNPEYRKKIELSTKGRPKSELTKQRMKIVANTIEVKSRLSHQAKYIRSEQVRLNMSKAQKINQNRPEVQAKKSVNIIKALTIKFRKIS